MQNLISSQEAFSAMMAGKNIMCRAVGELIKFDDLNQFPATIFAQPGYEFCIKRETTVLAEIQFTKPVEPHDLEVGQEIYIVMPTCILRTQYDNEHGDICLSIANGFAQLDEENAKLQLQAFGKAFGNMITEIEVKDGFNDKPKKTRVSRKKTEDKVEESVTTDAIEASVETAPVSKSRPAFTVDDVAEIETDANAIIEKFTSQIANCTTTDAVLSLRPIFFANGHLEREQQQHLCKLTEDKLLELDPEQYAPKIEIISQENVTTSEDSLISETVEQGEPDPEHQKHLDAILNTVNNAQTPIEVNAQIRYTKSWTEEQRKPVIQAMNKRLIELNQQKEVDAEQPPSLMVRIQNTQNERELNELLPEIRSRHADIQPKLMDLVKKRRFELENQGSQVAS